DLDLGVFRCSGVRPGAPGIFGSGWGRQAAPCGLLTHL
ncbi:uncharacterized protein METZ01_LOCUS55953, partial [marine metagenome]